MGARSHTLVAVAATFLSAGVARADPKADRQLASELVKKAIARSQVGDHSAAIDFYLQANTVSPNAALLSNIGAEYMQSGKPKEALRYFCMYLEKDPHGTSAPYATSQAKLLQAQLGNKDVDDSDVCARPRKPRLPAPDPEADPAPRSKVRLSGTGSPSETSGEPLPEVVSREGTTSQSGGSALKYAAITAGLVGVAGIGVGIYAGTQAQSLSDQLTHHATGTPWPLDVRAVERRGQDYENLQIGALIGGGALVATGVVLYLIDRSGREPTREASVRVAPTGNGMVVYGRF